MLSLFDDVLNAMPRSELYRSVIFPDVFRNEPVFRVDQWPKEDQEMYCGVYTTCREGGYCTDVWDSAAQTFRCTKCGSTSPG